jgi:hypothetical protein
LRAHAGQRSTVESVRLDLAKLSTKTLHQRLRLREEQRVAFVPACLRTAPKASRLELASEPVEVGVGRLRVARRHELHRRRRTGSGSVVASSGVVPAGVEAPRFPQKERELVPSIPRALDGGSIPKPQGQRGSTVPRRQGCPVRRNRQRPPSIPGAFHVPLLRHRAAGSPRWRISSWRRQGGALRRVIGLREVRGARRQERDPRPPACVTSVDHGPCGLPTSCFRDNAPRTPDSH